MYRAFSQAYGSKDETGTRSSRGGSSLIQRTASPGSITQAPAGCACGGGCPRCATAPNVRMELAQGGDQAEEEPGEPLSGEPDNGGAAQPQGGAIGGDATTATTSDLPGAAADWKNNGEFKWWIKWVTDGTSGWIVQKLDSTYSGTRADGTAITNASVGLEPSYYEAWEVDGTGKITGSLGATGNRDRWERPNLGALASITSLSITGTVYWTSSDPAKSGFTSGGVKNAGALLSSKSAPAGIGTALLTRNAYGRWAKEGSQILPGCFTSTS